MNPEVGGYKDEIIVKVIGGGVKRVGKNLRVGIMGADDEKGAWFRFEKIGEVFTGCDGQVFLREVL